MRQFLHLSLMLLAIVFSVVTCAPKSPPAPSRYAPTNLPPILPSGDFLAYIDASRARAVVVNQAMGTPLKPEDIAAVGPFEFRPKPPGKDCKGKARADYDKGVLLIHGLNDTPYSMWDLAARFSQECYLVRAILLPGHGTVPGDLTKVGLSAWRDAVAKAAWSFRGHVDRLVIAGFDLGANLALDAALDLGLPPEIELNGIVMLAPAFRYDPPRFSPAATGPGGDALWGDVFNETERVRYKSTAQPSVDAVNRLGRELFDRQAPRHIPLFVVASDDDAVTDPGMVQDWFCGQATTPRKLLWYTRYPCRPVPNCRCTVRYRDPTKDERQVCTVNRSVAHKLGFDGKAEDLGLETPKDCRSGGRLTPNSSILDLAHMALLAAPDNPRYGAARRRNDCLHYSWELGTPEERVCVGDLVGEGERYLRYGEASGSNLRNYILRRLTHNPDFNFMATAVLDFLDQND